MNIGQYMKPDVLVRIYYNRLELHENIQRVKLEDKLIGRN